MNVTLTNQRVLETLAALSAITPTTGIASVRLARIRVALTGQAQPIAIAFDETGKRLARRDDAGAPVVRLLDEKPLSWSHTGTPAYENTDDAAFMAETTALLAETVTFEVATLSERDLEQMTLARDVGELLLPFVAA